MAAIESRITSVGKQFVWLFKLKIVTKYNTQSDVVWLKNHDFSNLRTDSLQQRYFYHITYTSHVKRHLTEY